MNPCWAAAWNDCPKPTSDTVSVSFAKGRYNFVPDETSAAMLNFAKYASLVIISGRTSTLHRSSKDEKLALDRALSAQNYLIKQGVSAFKIMINYVSAADYIASNSTPEGQYLNQRVDIKMIHVPKD